MAEYLHLGKVTEVRDLIRVFQSVPDHAGIHLVIFPDESGSQINESYGPFWAYYDTDEGTLSIQNKEWDDGAS